MNNRLLLTLSTTVAVLLLLLPGFAAAAIIAPAGAASYSVGAPCLVSETISDSQCVQNSGSIPLSPGGKDLLWTVDNWSLTTSEYSLSISATLNGDPFINWAVKFTNFTDDPQSFSASFTVPLALAIYDSYTANASVTASGSNQGLFTFSTYSYADYPNPAFFWMLTNGIQNGGGGSGSTSGSPMTPGAYALLRVDVAGSLTTSGTLTSSGKTEIFSSAVPEPASMLLLGTGLAALAALRRLRRGR